MIYLLDANILIDANNEYYPIGDVPEFWEWLQYQGEAGVVKIPAEIWDEIRGNKKDPLRDWMAHTEVEDALVLDEDVDSALLNQVVSAGYASDLNDYELEQVGRDPFLVAYAMVDHSRCVVTAETSAPKRTRQNRKLPDVCSTLGVLYLDPWAFNKVLGFKTAWRKDIASK